MGGRISWVARSGGDGRTLRGLNLIGQKIFGTPFGGEAGCVEPRRKFDPSLQTYGKVKVSNLPAISDAILWKADAADCEMWDGHRHKF
ncbi:hypothetical protein TIFTF001_012847 [Ficus carica]|uniref:Uncharacterized protein n=1 Tax=Ficus carica TaxID=3494 RepID=A0AA88ANY1_FICCA|nr:hypothetical protein TIFTF001_012847 [Ficus carica]